MYNRKFDKLTRDVCWKLAKKCSTCSEFWHKYKTAADKASQEGWIGDYTWLTLKHERRLTRYRCYELAQDCHTRKELKQRHPGVLKRAKEEGWINDYTWLVSGRIKHTYSKCYITAKKYATMSDFRKHEPNVHNAAYKNGWLGDFSWLMRSPDIESRQNDNVYAYEFIEQHAVYIGRTVSVDERNTAHHQDKSSVARFAAKHHTIIPTMKLLETNITVKEGLIKEDYWVKQYGQNGWSIINIGKTGLSSGSLGAMGRYRMSKIKIETAARSCSTLKEFREKFPHEYDAACRRGYIETYTWLARERVPHNTWSYTGCYAEAQKYTTISDFRAKSPVAYTTACSNNWLDSFGWLNHTKAKNGTWSNASFDAIQAEAKQYMSRKEFMNGSKAAWRRAKSQGWLDGLFPLSRRYWDNYIDCKQEASKYTTRTKFAHGCNAAYYSSIRHGWIDDFFPKAAAM